MLRRPMYGCVHDKCIHTAGALTNELAKVMSPKSFHKEHEEATAVILRICLRKNCAEPLRFFRDTTRTQSVIFLVPVRTCMVTEILAPVAYDQILWPDLIGSCPNMFQIPRKNRTSKRISS